jgi:3',5'-cyclic AMP phosphodiesterase CpdA
LVTTHNRQHSQKECAISYPPARFAVFADIHYYDVGLGTEGGAFQRSLEKYHDIKLLTESPDILKAALAEVLALQVDFLLICGDLTKDGEESSHRLLAEKLREVSEKGIQVLIINGNHDVENQRAMRFLGDKEERVAKISAPEFVELYQECGYGSALERDPHSLSYLAEPVPGLWILCLDSCLWQKGCREEGRLKEETLAFAERIFQKARKERKALLGMMHHGVLEHYRGNKKFFGAYLIRDHERVADVFARGGLPVIFTGHFHSQDIALKTIPAENRFLFDVETGSLVTYPSPFRLITIDSGQRMHITSHRVTATTRHPSDFPAYAYRYCHTLAEKLAARKFRGFGVSRKDAALLAPQVVAAFRAHGMGNEEEARQALDVKGLSPWGRFVISFKKPLLEALWEQGAPPDNQLTIDLQTGEYE